MQDNVTQAQTLPTTGTITSRIGSLGFEGGYPTSETVAQDRFQILKRQSHQFGHLGGIGCTHILPQNPKPLFLQHFAPQK